MYVRRDTRGLHRSHKEPIPTLETPSRSKAASAQQDAVSGLDTVGHPSQQGLGIENVLGQSRFPFQSIRNLIGASRSSLVLASLQVQAQAPSLPAECVRVWHLAQCDNNWARDVAQVGLFPSRPSMKPSIYSQTWLIQCGGQLVTLARANPASNPSPSPHSDTMTTTLNASKGGITPRGGAASFSGQLGGRHSRRASPFSSSAASHRTPIGGRRRPLRLREIQQLNSISNAKDAIKTASSTPTIAPSPTPRPSRVSRARPWTRVTSSI
ncbi:hypothetical protein BD779DRAFT_1791349 [Infundibulicybe gibba]|nr:hypothetical protein BD779DRAFT_1791349 [Infundibulicybe gibba]